ncbi:hypothetical protein C7E12_23325, partial [Stenotrophomonas maltophilia]
RALQNDNAQKLEQMRHTVDEKLQLDAGNATGQFLQARALQNDNAQKLEQMRHTVDEKLQLDAGNATGQF